MYGVIVFIGFFVALNGLQLRGTLQLIEATNQRIFTAYGSVGQSDKISNKG
jgi:hypothetical protein